MKIVICLVLMGLLSSCSSLFMGRSYEDVMEDTPSLFTPGRDFPVTAFESDDIRMDDKEILSRTPLTKKQSEKFEHERSLMVELNRKERMLEGSERSLYSKHKGSLKGISDKLYYLDLSPQGRRDYLVDIGAMEYRNKYSRGRKIASVAFGDMSLEGPLFLGMTKDKVITSWGSPTDVAYAGRAELQNERWSFIRNGAVNVIFFEAGRVSGWQLN